MRTNMLAAAAAGWMLAASAQAATWTVTPYAGVPGAIYSQAMGMNDLGTLVVQSDSGSYIDDHGVFTSYAGFGPHDFGGLTDISNSGVLVGNRNGVGFIDDHGTLTHLNVAGSTYTNAFSISANGRYVSGTYGTSADWHSQEGFVYDRATSTYSTVLAPVDQYVDALGGVNDAGVAVGDFSDDDYMSTSFLYDAVAGTHQEIGEFGGLHGPLVISINDAGELAGLSFEPNPEFRIVGFVGTPGGSVATIAPPAPDDFLQVRDLTNSGLALGQVIGPDGSPSNVLLTEVSAVPEPSSSLLLVCALAALCAGARRRASDAR